jgi:predicted phosphodiesterase
MAETAAPEPRWGTPVLPNARWVRLTIEIVLVGLLGAVLGLTVAGSTTRDVGPFSANLSIRPALAGASIVEIPPLGELRFNTHKGPMLVDIRLERLKKSAAEAIVSDPDRLQSLGSDVDRDVRGGLLLLVARTLVVAVLGAFLLGLLAFRRPRVAAMCGASGLALVFVVGAGAAATFNRAALTEPRFTGLLTVAPNVVGDAQDIASRFDSYSRQLGRLVANVSALYAATSSLPSFTAGPGTIRVLHVSDLHLNPAGIDVVRRVVTQFSINVVIDSGDLTDHGSSLENEFVAQLASLGVPYVYVRGNHDSAQTERAVAALKGATVLDGQVHTVAGISLLGSGDPRFTPDKTTHGDDAPSSVLTAQGDALAAVLASGAVVDVAVVHDPAAAGPLLGHVPLVLAGHTHKRKVEQQDGTLLMIEGSTGGAGLRGLEGDSPTPIELSVLYLNPLTHRTQAYDEITVGGLGASEVRIVRHVVGAPAPTPTSTSSPT